MFSNNKTLYINTFGFMRLSSIYLPIFIVERVLTQSLLQKDAIVWRETQLLRSGNVIWDLIEPQVVVVEM